MVVKTKDEAKANFEGAIPYIPARYQAGVRKADWAGPAGSDVAEQNYADGVGKAIAKKTRQTEVKKVSNADWQEDAATKGGAIIGDRIRESLDKWSAEWGPIYDGVVSDVDRLPPKTTDWRANITARLVKTVESWKKHSGKL